VKALAWYSIIFNILVIIAFILFLAGAIDMPPFTALEAVIWAVFTIPLILLGWMVIRKPQ